MARYSQKPKHPDLSIIIPAYNEARRIGGTLDKLAAYLKSGAYFTRKRIEVIVSAADCTDTTKDIVRQKQRLFRDLILLETGPSRGKGYAVRSGVLSSRGSYVIYMDADLATPLYHLEQFYKACVSGADLVIGTRNLLQYRPSFVRRVTSIVGNVLFRLASNLWIEDSQCGFKMFRRAAARSCFGRLTIFGWGFDMEILAIARSNNMQIQCARIDDWTDVPHTTFTDNILVICLHSIFDLTHILRHRITRQYRVGHNGTGVKNRAAEAVESYS